MASTQTPRCDTHTVRRIKFGTNVAVALIASVGITILINWIAARAYIRADLTQGGSYSLSEQTKTILGKLDGDYRLVTLLPSESSVADEDTALVYRRVRDMTEEYARYSEHLSAENIDPRGDINKARKLNDAIAETFADELAPVKEAIAQGRAALKAVAPINTKLEALLTGGLNSEASQTETSVQQLFQAAATRCKQFEKTAEQAEQQTQELMDQVLVNYAGVKEQFKGVLSDYDTLLGVIVQSAERLTRDANTPNADKERLLEAIELCKQAQAELVEPMQKMDEAQDAPRYNQVFYGLSAGASVVALGPNKVKVIPVSEMWRQDMRDVQDTGRAQPQYLIEEKLTGSLLSMTLEQPPLVVFVLSNTGAAQGPQGNYNIVSQRLQNADFEVTQWNPGGQVSAMGQRTPPQPRPEPAPGQKVVWVVLPSLGEQMGNPMLMGANPRQQIAELLEERLAAGDSAMVMLAADPSSIYGLANPITELLSTWGINVQTDRIILEEVPQANRRNTTVLQFLVDTWPDSLPITTALAGMQAAFQIASPIVTDSEKGATHHPLVEVTGARLWTHTDLSSPQAVQGAKYDQTQSAPSFTIAFASEKDKARMVTIAEQVWASDDMTGLGLLGPGTAELTGAMVPGNSELFVNSVFWLAGLEDLIAASPRAQDVPRIFPMSENMLWWNQVLLLAGLPLGTFAIGMTVWWVRRSA